MIILILIIILTATKVLPLFKEISSIHTFRIALTRFIILGLLAFIQSSIQSIGSLGLFILPFLKIVKKFFGFLFKYGLNFLHFCIILILLKRFILEYFDFNIMDVFDFYVFSFFQSSSFFISYGVEKVLSQNISFHNKIIKIQNNFYQQTYGFNDEIFSDIDNDGFSFGVVLKFMGLAFIFDVMDERYRLLDKSYDSLELLCIGECMLRNMNSINKKGFMVKDFIDNNFMAHISSHLESLGYEKKLLGNSELPYTL